MVQVARNVTMEEGVSWHLASISSMTATPNSAAAFQQIIDAAGVTRVPCRRGRQISMPMRNAG
jgi:hypothetical protein